MSRWVQVVLVVAVLVVLGTVDSPSAHAKRLGQGGSYEVVPGPSAIYAQPVHSVQRPIAYKHHHLRGPKCKSCLPPIQMVLQVKDPCTCCLVDVPVCVPACCSDVPDVSCRRGLLGRTIVSYQWCCGFHLNVVFDRFGCVTVHYFGG